MNTLYPISYRWASIDETIQSTLAEVGAESDNDIAVIVDEIVTRLQSDTEDAVHDGVNYLRSLESLARAKRDEARTLTEQARAIEDRAAIAKHAIQKIVDWRFGGHIVAGPYDIRTRKVPPAVVVDDIDPQALPLQFCKVTYSANKAAIKLALQSGEHLEFARLGEPRRTITIK